MSNGDSGSNGGDTKNPDLQELQDSLVAKIGALSKEIGQAPDAATVDAINTEIDEVSHRATIVGGMLFTQQTKSITAAMDKVRAVEDEVAKDVQNIDDLTDFLNTMKSFLTLVDKVIDTAKLVGV
jgi:hypothetical protein